MFSYYGSECLSNKSHFSNKFLSFLQKKTNKKTNKKKKIRVQVMPNRNTFFKRRRTHPGDPTVVHPHGLEWRGHCVGFGLAQSPVCFLPLYLVTMAGLTKRVVVTAERR